MKRKQSLFLCWVPVLLCLLLIGPAAALAAEPIVIGVPTSTGFLEGKEALLGAIAMTPASEEKVKQDPEKYKYIFRLALNAKYLVKYLAGTMGFINAEYGFNKVYIMNQDVDWARKTAEIIGDVYFKKAGWTIVGQESYPTGTIIYAIINSAILALTAIGFNLTFGISGVAMCPADIDNPP